jgi:hypothetical protein
MVSKLTALLFLASVILFSSCKKDNTPTALNPDVFQNHITAVIHYDEDDTIPSASNFYHYDSQQRLESYSAIDGDIPSNTVDEYDSAVFTYNGSDTLPVEATVYDVIGGGIAHKYYYYDDQRRLIKDSVDGDIGSSLTPYSSETYVYTPGLITITAYSTTAPPGTTLLYLTADNKNITKAVNNDPASATGSGTISYQYNANLVNPYYLNNVGRNLYYFGYFLSAFSSTQNAFSRLTVTAPTGNGAINVAYSNIANSLPGKAIFTNAADNSVFYTEYYYYQ